MAVRINPSSPAGQFLIDQGVEQIVLESATFRVLNKQAGAAITVVWPNRRATVFIKSSYLQPDGDGNLPVDRKLPLIRHELHHVEQGRDWGFIGYWAKQLWARARHMSLLARDSSVEAPAYELQRKAHETLDEMGL